MSLTSPRAVPALIFATSRSTDPQATWSFFTDRSASAWAFESPLILTVLSSEWSRWMRSVSFVHSGTAAKLNLPSSPSLPMPSFSRAVFPFLMPRRSTLLPGMSSFTAAIGVEESWYFQVRS